jgi:DNA recombination protein RmuC
VDASLLLVALAGLAAGAAGAWLALRGRLRADAQAAAMAERAGLTARLEERDRRIEALQGEVMRREAALAEAQAARLEVSAGHAALQATLDQERKAAEEKLRLLDEAQAKLGDAFKALSAKTLEAQGESFLQLARTALEKVQETAKGDLEKRQQAIQELVAPVKDSLGKLDVKIGAIEKEREGAYRELTLQVRSLGEAQLQLRTEAANLVKALRAPQVRGRWGEVQLKRVVELAGMVNYCDFVEQETLTTEAGRLRPDLIVRLPGGKSVVVDAKAPLSAYLEAVEAQDDATRQAKLAEHARQVRDHVAALSRKSYWDQFQSSAPEFVVMFLPGESFFSAALEQDPGLIEAGAAKNVVIATPTTLIVLLRAVAYGWKQEKIAENAQRIADLGRQIYERLADMGGHLARVGRNLGQATSAYNAAMGSLESRVLVSARKLKELEAGGGADKEIEPLEPVAEVPRRLAAPELVPASADDEGPIPERAAAR